MLQKNAKIQQGNGFTRTGKKRASAVGNGATEILSRNASDQLIYENQFRFLSPIYVL